MWDLVSASRSACSEGLGSAWEAGPAPRLRGVQDGAGYGAGPVSWHWQVRLDTVGPRAGLALTLPFLRCFSPLLELSWALSQCPVFSWAGISFCLPGSWVRCGSVKAQRWGAGRPPYPMGRRSQALLPGKGPPSSPMLRPKPSAPPALADSGLSALPPALPAWCWCRGFRCRPLP